MSRQNNNADVSKSWFCVFNNPEEHGYDGTPEQVVNKIIDNWIKDNPQRTCAINYCISAEGLKHCHAVFEDMTALRFSKIKKAFPAMHIEPTKGSKEQAENYINKRPPFDEQGEQVIYTNRHGEIKGYQGARRDFGIIEELIQQGKTPREILKLSLAYRRYEKIIRDAYYDKRKDETPATRQITTYYHVGDSGCGKSYSEVELVNTHGEDNIYKVCQYENGFADKYSGEPILFMDDVKPDDGKMSYKLLLTILDCYKNQIHARYTNIIGLWNEVHITSVFPPDILYENMKIRNRDIDTYEQLRRRINFMVYHYKKNGEYLMHTIPMSEYQHYEHLKSLVETPTKRKIFATEQMGENDQFLMALTDKSVIDAITIKRKPRDGD